jgi:excisionase family DNA binding protein
VISIKREADMAPSKNKRRKVLAKRAAADVMTVEDVATRLGIGRNQAYEAVAAGKIPGAFRLGRRWLIPRVAFEKMLAGETHATSDSAPHRPRKATAAETTVTI